MSKHKGALEGKERRERERKGKVGRDGQKGKGQTSHKNLLLYEGEWGKGRGGGEGSSPTLRRKMLQRHCLFPPPPTPHLHDPHQRRRTLTAPLSPTTTPPFFWRSVTAHGFVMAPPLLLSFSFPGLNVCVCVLYFWKGKKGRRTQSPKTRRSSETPTGQIGPQKCNPPLPLSSLGVQAVPLFFQSAVRK